MDANANPLDPRSPCGALPSLYLTSLLCLGTVSFSVCLLAQQAAYAYTETQSTLAQEPAIDATTLSEDSLNSHQDSALQSWNQIQVDAEAEPLSHLIDKFDHGFDPELNQAEVPVNTAVMRSTDDSLSADHSQLSSPDAVVPEVLQSEVAEPEATEPEGIEPEATEIGVTELETLGTAQVAEPVITVERSEGSYVGVSAESIAAFTTASLLPTLEVSQMPAATEPEPREASTPAPDNELDRLQLRTQGVYLFEENESSARIRLTGSYALTPNVLFGSTLDWTTGDAFFQSDETGFSVNELFVTLSPPAVPQFRVTVGMIDLTSYFDRNSFAKDVATQFFNPVFQTNPALSAAGINSRPGVLVNWALTDNLSLRGAAFSSDRDLNDFQFDAAAAELDFRFGNAIIRGTYATDRDAGYNDGFQEIYSFNRGNDNYGLEPGDREISYGLNAEVFIPELNLGLFGRYGWYNNETLDVGANTYSVGLNALDLFFADDRLGLAYGRQLSNDELRDQQDEQVPDVVELFYDVRVLPFLRVGVSLQQRNGFSETFAGFRIRGDLDLAGLWR